MMDRQRDPVRTLSYRLTRADALAFKMLKTELTGREKLVLLVIVGCGGLVVGMIPDGLSVAVWWAMAATIMALSGALAIAWTNISLRRQASAIVLPEGDVFLEERRDHLIERSASGSRHVGYDAVAGVALTESHVFIVEGRSPLIVPAAAFEDRSEMAEFARRVDEASRRAQP